MCLNHPETTPSLPSMEEVSSVKLDPGAKRLGTAAVAMWGQWCIWRAWRPCALALWTSSICYS